MTLPVMKSHDICGAEDRAVGKIEVDEAGGLKNAVVYIEKIESGKEWSENGKSSELQQKGCRFVPWIQVIRNKSELAVTNQDPVLHNIHAYEVYNDDRKTIFNEAQPIKGMVVKKKIRLRKGNVFKAECDVHNFMHAHALVLNNPYYAITSDNGTYSIEKIPPGAYEVTVWSPLLGKSTQKIEVGAGEELSFDHEFTK